MSKLISSIIFSFFLLFQTISLADEYGEIERLVVPESVDDALQADEGETEVVQEEILAEEGTPSNEGSEIPEEVVSAEETSIDTSETASTDTVQDDEASNEEAPEVVDAPEVEVVEAPSEDELEARRAEEAELREVGAGEEPVIEE